ncbi:MAG: HlyC/CorC family transporter [Candidatus Accumulibacter sp.]|jgi:putative hemolysin|uniref:hemolysin family protein n=1 Tax=Accumulibacter sp. TaxID=2053492 RepID=UPI0025836F01|nr:hemolysin family protein [Accumulibacter sp.]MBK8116007.1 HlyC/CorC family transporter [Accumulibacter sp.]
MELVLQLLVILVFLVLKGFFSGSELAMVNSDKIHLRHQARLGDPGAKLVLNLFRTPDVMLGTTLVGTNIATVTITTMGTLIFVHLFGDNGDLFSVLIFTPFLLIFGEIVPKSIFQQKADWIATRIIYPLRFFSYVFYPVIFIFSRVARVAARLFGGATSGQSGFITKDELRVLIDLSETASDSAATSKQRIRRIFRFADTTVGEVMTPLAEVIGFNEAREMGEAVRRVWASGFNRLPVFRGNITNVTGVMTLSTWDLLLPDIEQRPVEEFVKPALYLTPKQNLDQVLPLLRARTDHMAIVVDEFGSAIGILTMEDIFEEVVGAVDSGYDFDTIKTRRVSIESAGDDTHVVSGRAPISELNDSLKLNLPVGEAHTVAGFLINRLRHIPEVGDTVVEQGYRYTVIEADARTVTKVRVERL